MEQPLVPGLARDHADLELAEAGVHHDVVALAGVRPAGGGVSGVVVEHGRDEQVVGHGKELQSIRRAQGWTLKYIIAKNSKKVNILLVLNREE